MDKIYTNKTVVSFDIFDTLIKRCVPKPRDVFELVERYCKDNDISVPERFKEKRIEAERFVNELNSRPCTIREIYDCFYQHNGGASDKLEEIEKTIELAVCKPNDDVVELYHECIKAGKRVFIISDMYLDSDFLERLLTNCGITGYEKLFVSCEYRASKSTGRLFELIRDEIKIEPKQWLHIGDNLKSDIISPKKIGISTHQIPADKKNNYPIKTNINSTLDFEIVNRCVNIMGRQVNTSSSMGAKVLGTLLAGFSKWLFDQAKQKNIQRVFFLSRDGYAMKRAFDVINQGEFETKYIYASRRSWTVPAIWLEPEYEDILSNITMSPKTSVKTFITRLGLLPEDCQSEIQKCELTMDTIINRSELLESKKLRQLYSLIKNRVIENSKEEYAAVVKYLQENNVNGRFAVVDIGYSGTMQKALKEILKTAGISSEILGFYIGINPDSRIIKNKEIEAYSFFYGPDLDNDYQNKRNAFSSVFETIFLAQHGSVYRFKLNDNSPSVQLYDYEYDLQESKYVDEASIIKDFQDGAIEYVKFVAEMLNKGILRIDNEAAFNNLLYMALKPEKKGVELFADFRMLDAEILHIARPDAIMRYLLSPSKFKKDFANSSWKIAFLYRMFKIPVSYEKIYYRLKKHFKS